MTVATSQKRDVEVEGVTAARLASDDVSRFGALSTLEDRAPIRIGGKAALKGELRFALAQCNPANVPGLVSNSCFGKGTIVPAGTASRSGGQALLRVSDGGTCQGQCLEWQGSTVVSRPQRCRVKLVESGQAAGSPAAGPAKSDTPASADRQRAPRRSRPYRVRLSVAAVSWIDPFFLTDPDLRMLEPDWAPGSSLRETMWFARTLYALRCTGNPDPPPVLKDVRGVWRRLWRRGRLEAEVDVDTFREGPEFRAMLYASLIVEIDPQRDRVLRAVKGRHFTDPGWTRPFDLDRCPAGYLGFFEGNLTPLDRAAHPGEQSALSGCRYFPQRHPSSAVTAAGPHEQPVLNGLVKMRAGRQTDTIGVSKAHSPYHVPWVWCELLVTYHHGQFRLHGLGSEFPSHAWYVNERRVAVQPQTGDAAILTRTVGGSREIDLARMNLHRVLSLGIPAKEPQSDPGRDAATGPLPTHPHTAAPGRPVLYTWPAR
jgi:hypothetical protein